MVRMLKIAEPLLQFLPEVEMPDRKVYFFTPPSRLATFYAIHPKMGLTVTTVEVPLPSLLISHQILLHISFFCFADSVQGARPVDNRHALHFPGACAREQKNCEI